MKLGHVIATAVLLTPIPFAGMTNPAAASSSHTVVVNGKMTVTDSGSFPLNNVHIVNFEMPTRTFILTHARPTGRVVHRVCAAEETRGQLTIQVVLQPSERVDALAELKLYEESTCENLDLDDTDWAATSVNPGQTRQMKRLWVTNAQEVQSWDSAEATVTVAQEPSPPEPPQPKLPPLLEEWKKHCQTNKNACGKL
ncbi:hypothetical protein [Streptomyces sp. NPDC001903]|uniref:hypothetical protein n=1 Tax=Streptomyces sp. NPDC001903 TaxID=3364622 RepID=UPI0036AC4A59